MIGISIPNGNKKEKVITEKVPTTYTEGCTLEDLKDELIKNKTKFEIQMHEEYYRRKTKSLPKHIDICCGYAEYKNYNEFMKDPNYEKYSKVPIKKISLGGKTSCNGAEFINDIMNNVTRKVLIVQLKKISLDDTTTPRRYSLRVDKDEMVKNDLKDLEDAEKWWK